MWLLANFHASVFKVFEPGSYELDKWVPSKSRLEEDRACSRPCDNKKRKGEIQKDKFYHRAPPKINNRLCY